VIGTSRSRKKADTLREQGAEAVVLDVLDPPAVLEAVTAATPDAIVHEATALAGMNDIKNFDRSFAQTNRLRAEGTDALLAAARKAGVRRFVAQSFAGWPYARQGGPVKTEEDPLDPAPVPAMAETLDAIRQSGVVLMTEIRGASNAKAKRELGWAPPLPKLARGFPRRLRRHVRRYLTSESILNIGRYIEMMITPTMQPTPIIISGSMIEVNEEIDASTSSS
jgi:hypothetical protein